MKELEIQREKYKLSARCQRAPQIWPFLVVVSQRTAKKCTEMENARAGRGERAEIVGFAY